MRTCFPSECSGALSAAEEEWVERLAANRYGTHAAWHAPRGEAKNGEVELIPWLLFNRQMWDEALEMLGADENTLVLRVASQQDNHPGWFVEVEVDINLSVQRIEALRTDDPSALGDETLGAIMLEAGQLPPPTGVSAAAARQRKWLVSAVACVLSGGLTFVGMRFLGADADQVAAVAAMRTDMIMLEAENAHYTTQLQGVQTSGLSPERALRLALEAVRAGADLEVMGQVVRWRGEGSPNGLSCGEAAKDDNDWRPCAWEVESG